MSTKKYKWLTLGLASVVISGCAIGNKPNLNLGIADALRKSKSCLFKKQLSYQAPVTNSAFGYARPFSGESIVLPSVASLPANATSSSLTSDCNCNANSSEAVPGAEFYMPPRTPAELVTPPSFPTTNRTEIDSFNSVPTTEFNYETSVDSLNLNNPLPATIEEVPNTQASPAIEINRLDLNEQQGTIDTLDSASLDLEEFHESLTPSPKKDEASILESAAKELEAKTPTSAGHSVVDHRSRMLTLTARPAQSHQVFDAENRRRDQADMQQITHKRHFRQQNSLRPLHSKFRSDAFEHTAEAPAPLKFKPLPLLSKELNEGKPSNVNTGAPALNRKSNQGTHKDSSTEMQRLPVPVRELESDTEQESVLKIARLPILKAETTSSAAIGSLRNFTNVRDLDPDFDKDYYSRNSAEVATVEVSGSEDDLTIDR